MDLRSRPGKLKVYGWISPIIGPYLFNALDWTDHGSCLFGVCEEQTQRSGNGRFMQSSSQVSLAYLDSRIIAGRPAESFKIGLDQRLSGRRQTSRALGGGVPVRVVTCQGRVFSSFRGLLHVEKSCSWHLQSTGAIEGTIQMSMSGMLVFNAPATCQPSSVICTEFPH